MPEQVALARIAPGGSALVTGPYRYELQRWWNDGPKVTWIMLNPSTADARQDDPTIRRVIGFSKQWGYGGVVVVNLFGLRATDPRELRKHPDPVGPNNDAVIACHLHHGNLIVCAWGASPEAASRSLWVARFAASERYDLRCLGVTSSGAPRHPLYVRSDAKLIPWPRKENSARD